MPRQRVCSEPLRNRRGSEPGCRAPAILGILLACWAPAVAQSSEPTSADAQYSLGIQYWYGNGVPQSYPEALRWFLKAAEQGFTDAQYRAAQMYEIGQGVAADYAQAANWYRKAAEAGVALAQYNLGTMYVAGRGVPHDYAEAAKWFGKAASQGVAMAQYNLGIAYREGQGVTQDAKEALRWFQLAAEQGDAPAQFSLGMAYAGGQGIPKNMAEAVTWFRKAADQDYALAELNLGVLYALGEGVGQDYTQAAEWYRRAAESGLSQAQDDLKTLGNAGIAAAQDVLGMIYENGWGTPKSATDAVLWYRKAAEQGHAFAQQAPTLSDDDLDKTLQLKDTLYERAQTRRQAPHDTDGSSTHGRQLLPELPKTPGGSPEGPESLRGGVQGDIPSFQRTAPAKVAITNLAQAIRDLFPRAGPRVNYSGIGATAKFLPGSNLHQLEKASADTHTKALRAAGARVADDLGQGLAVGDAFARGAVGRAAQFHLGRMYAAGLGVAKNDTAARDWLSKAAAQGFSEERANPKNTPK